MFEKSGVTERKKTKKKTIDFGETLGNDEVINATFKALHEEPTSLSVFGPVNKPDVEPVNKPAQHPAKAGYPDSEPVHEPAQHPANKPAHKPVNRPAHEPDSEPVHEPVHYQINQPAKRQAKHPAKPIAPEQWYPYTEKQGRVLLYLITAGGRTKRKSISMDTGVNIATVKYSLRVFVKDGFISPTTLDVNHTMRGFTYALNPHLCNEYASRILGLDFVPISHPANQPAKYQAHKPVHYPDDWPVLKPAHEPAHYPVHEPDSPFSSSSLDDKTTTTKTGPGNENFLTGAIGAYWEEEGLSESQASKWCQQFEVEPAVMKLQLEWARFDLENNGRRTDVKKDAVSWFFGHLRTTGGSFPRPVNYRSPAELRAEAIEQDLAREKDARERLVAAEIEQAFQRILTDPDGQEYKALLNQTNEFAKDIGGLALETILREIFVKGMGG